MRKRDARKEYESDIKKTQKESMREKTRSEGEARRKEGLFNEIVI